MTTHSLYRCEIFSVKRKILDLAHVLETIQFHEHLYLHIVNVTTECVVLSNLHDLQTEPVFVKKNMNIHVINPRHCAECMMLEKCK